MIRIFSNDNLFYLLLLIHQNGQCQKRFPVHGLHVAVPEPTSQDFIVFEPHPPQFLYSFFLNNNIIFKRKKVLSLLSYLYIYFTGISSFKGDSNLVMFTVLNAVSYLYTCLFIYKEGIYSLKK